MKLYNLCDIGLSEVKSRSYDFIFYFSGYEERCTYLAKHLPFDRGATTFVFASKDTENNKVRDASDKFYLENLVKRIHNLNGVDDFSYIYKLMRDKCGGHKELKLLIDYSSMQRTIYAALLNWARFQDCYDSIQIDFVYASGVYSKKRTPMTIKNILSLPGFEGNTYKRKQSIVIFGLGFEGLAAECVLDRLEPDRIFTYLANPAASRGTYKTSIVLNKNIMDMASLNIELSLNSVEDGFRSLSEVINQYVSDCRLTMVPMGPKPHVLTSLLLCIRYASITCLHVSGREKNIENVLPSGDLACTRVNLKGE